MPTNISLAERAIADKPDKPITYVCWKNYSIINDKNRKILSKPEFQLGDIEKDTKRKTIEKVIKRK